MADRNKPINETLRGLVYGSLIGWGAGMLWWTSLVIVFGLKPSVVAVVVDSTGRHETQVTVLERFALVPVRSIPWAAVAGVVGAVVGWRRRRTSMGERPAANLRVVTGLAYGLLVGWIVGILSWTSLAIALGPSGDSYDHVGVKHVEHFYPVLEMLANIRWTVVPWAVVGALAGAIIGRIGGWIEAITSLLGMIGGIGLVLSTSRFDGWLAITVPIYAFIGAGAGLVGGLLVRHVIIRFVRSIGIQRGISAKR